MAKVIHSTIDSNGVLVYDVEFPDGAVKYYAANVISENLLSQVDSSGFYKNTWIRL